LENGVKLSQSMAAVLTIPVPFGSPRVYMPNFPAPSSSQERRDADVCSLLGHVLTSRFLTGGF
jgi:hypothetical protein